MPTLRTIADGLRSLFRKQRVDTELDEELRGFLEMAAEEKMKQGASREEALRAVRLEHGNLEAAKEVVRDAHWESFLETCWRDLRFALRTLRKSPGFTAVAVITLALGIGANTAIFSLVNTVFFKPVSAGNCNELVTVFFGDLEGHGLSNHSYADYLDYRKESGDVLSGLAAYTTLPANLVVGQATERINVGLVSDNYFSVLRVRPIIGRTFLPEDTGKTGDAFTAVISESLWRREFGGTRDLAGKSVWLNNSSYNVIGIVPEQAARMANIVKIDVFVPAETKGVLDGDRDFVAKRLNKEFMVVGRLSPGVTLGKAQAKFKVIADELQKVYPDAWTENRHVRPLSLVPYSSVPFELRGLVVGFVGLLMGAVGIVLLIACNNLANFLLTRGMARKKEIAVRLALGASRGRLVQQLLTENLMVALLGGTLGFVLALCTKGLLARFTPNLGVPLVIDLSLDYRVFGFSAIMTLLTTVAFGLAPALQATKTDANEGLKEADQTQTVGQRRARLRNWLMVAQVAVSLVLLMCASIFMSSVFKLRSIDLGFNPSNLALLSVNPNVQGYSPGRTKEFIRQATERLRAVPGVQTVSVASAVPMGLSSVRDQILPRAQTAPHAQTPFFVGSNRVDPSYFETMHIPLLRGRAFEPQDRDGEPLVVIVNEALARRLWPNQESVGQFIQKLDGRTFEVIAVAKTGKYESLSEESVPFVYFPLDQTDGYSSELTFYVRTAIPPEPLLDTFRQQVVAHNPALTVFDVETMNQHLADSLLLVRMGAILLSVFGGLALALASLGLYGQMGYLVRQRTREMGIRIALGASPSNVLNLILRQGISLTIRGAAIGSLFGFSISILIASQLYGIAPTDIVTLVAVTSTQFGIALFACWFPARRAMRVDPMVALRYE
jgi:macrolide transport system ATP-binding/permease protein